MADEPFGEVMGKSSGSQGRVGVTMCEQLGFSPTRGLQMQYSL